VQESQAGGALGVPRQTRFFPPVPGPSNCLGETRQGNRSEQKGRKGVAIKEDPGTAIHRGSLGRVRKKDYRV